MCTIYFHLVPKYADSEVFLAEASTEPACLNYVNIHVDDHLGAAAAPGIPPASAGVSRLVPASSGVPAVSRLDSWLPPTHEVVGETKYTYLDFQAPKVS